MKPTREELVKLYEIDKLPTRQIGGLFGVSKTSVMGWLKLYWIKPRPNGRGLERNGFKQPTEEELQEMIHIKHLSYTEIGKIYNVDRSAIFYWVKKFGMKSRNEWINRTIGVPTSEELNQMYNIEKLPTTEIAEKYGMSTPILKQFFKKFNIEIRPSGFGGKRFVCKDGHIVMSSYELRVDDWLHENNIEHIYEPSISHKTHCHADFFANGFHIEVWGISKSEKYAKRRTEKQQFYKTNNIPLIEINWHDFATKRKDAWKTKLKILKSLNNNHLQLDII